MLKTTLTSALTAALVCACFAAVRYAEAARAAGGSFTLYSPGNPVVTQTTINSAWANNTLSDIATELTDSLSRSNKGAMLAPLSLYDGSVSAPGLTFGTEAGTGLYRIGATDIGFAISGTKKLELTSSLFTVTPNATFSGTLGAVGDFSVNTNKFTVVASSGNTAVAGTLAVTGAATLGATGTAVSASFRGTTSWTPGSINTLSIGQTTITLTGAAAGADCHVAGPGVQLLAPICWVTLNTCNIAIGNPSAGSITALAGTYTCRVWNP